MNARNERQVRGTRYGYHAYVEGKGNLLRYDNSHAPDEFHRHVYDFASRKQQPLELVTREEFPTLIEVIDEVQAMAERLGLAG